MKHYFDSLFNDNLTFILGWEVFVLLTTIFYVRIVYRLIKCESKIETLIDEVKSLREMLMP
ncbi:MAG: hypothetical protein Unbinned6224contig1001_1 [Prokaryotic dsDNA virus sp.]|nr:MAG: hypothetical protein Unbinned6224contig1001_1 [Prokaryotic dsDNA virus sp.]